VDLRAEKTALEEAMTTRIPIVALCDTNVNPNDVAYPIPANDDAVKGIEMLTHLIAEAIKEGKKEAEKNAAAALAAKEKPAAPAPKQEEKVNA
jgi:small subunit ribosomal protein S2